MSPAEASGLARVFDELADVRSAVGGGNLAYISRQTCVDTADLLRAQAAEIERLRSLLFQVRDELHCGHVGNAPDAAHRLQTRYDNARARICTLETEIERLRAETTWVPVSERLPEPERRVLAYVPTWWPLRSDQPFLAHRVAGLDFFDTRRGQMVTGVMWWRPLPDAPTAPQGGQEAPR